MKQNAEAIGNHHDPSKDNCPGCTTCESKSKSKSKSKSNLDTPLMKVMEHAQCVRGGLWISQKDCREEEEEVSPSSECPS